MQLFWETFCIFETVFFSKLVPQLNSATELTSFAFNMENYMLDKVTGIYQKQSLVEVLGKVSCKRKNILVFFWFC